VKEIVLKIKRIIKVPVEACEISPQTFSRKSVSEIEGIEIWEGNRRVRLNSIFSVEGDANAPPNELTIRVIGDAGKIRKIGYRMAVGSIVIEGDAGMYLGEEMFGGTIIVNGNAGSWLGSKMRGGKIEVKGNAGDYVGSAYRGSTRGMKGGSIVVIGDAGNEIGCWMRNGSIIVKGNAGMFPGIHMSGGTILIEGNCGGRAGAQMTGGRVVVGGYVPSILPSFSFEGIRDKVKVNDEKVTGPFYGFIGDVNEGGGGRLFVNVNSNPHLKWYERYLE
jgi:formylmethanofuran dehydrogenase subunit C